MASLFNETPVDDIDAYEWIVALPSHARFGESVDEQLLDDGVTLGDSGLVMLDGNETFVRRIATSQKAEFLTEADASRGDLRLLGTFKDGQGMAGIAKDMKWGHLMIFLNTFKIKTNGDVCRYLRIILVTRSCHKGEDM